ncbi:MAG: response regulator [Anaerolineae bacterium]|nr:response regulator [Anaerolineae bacterium]
MSHQATILIVDDDPILLDSVADILRNAGYKPMTAINGMIALRVLQNHTADLIVADIMMPEMDGYQFCHAVRMNPDWRAIPFIFLTARSGQDDIRRGYGLGADHYITKPFEPEDLLLAIQTKLRRLAEIRDATRDEVESTTNKLMTVFGNELHGPVSFIYDYISLLRDSRQILGKETTEEVLAQMHRGVDELVGVVEDLMLAVYIDSGAMEIEIERRCERVELEPALQAAVRELSIEAEQREVSVSLHVPSDLAVSGVPVYIQDIYRRLIDYAIKTAKPIDGHVWIEVERQEEQIVASIRNNGSGIVPDRLARFFSPSREADRQVMAEEVTGIDLAIAERLARLHEGSISIDGKPDKGMIFTVTLPTASQQTPDT